MADELDQVVNVYRAKLKQVGDLWSNLMRHEKYDPIFVRTTQETLEQVEMVTSHFMEEQLTAEKAKQKVRNLKQVLDVTRQIVEAKSRHVRTAEQQLEEEQNSRLKEFQKIHKIEDEKVEIEKGVKQVREKLEMVMEKLTRKCTMHRYLEDFTDCLTEQLSLDLVAVKTQAEMARKERSVWDRFDVDVLGQIKQMAFDDERLRNLQQNVQHMKESLQNQTRWYEEELQTKLFYSSRNKEIQTKIATLKTILKRMERSGRSEEREESSVSNKPFCVDDFTIKAMVDGIADIQAKDVEEYLSHQFGIRVMADYSMLRRLKEEIGVVGLAYLVERIRFQDIFASVSKSNRTYKDMEENKIETALKTIAMEYKLQDETHKSWASREMSQNPMYKNDVQENDVNKQDSPPRPSVVSSPSGISSPTASGTTDVFPSLRNGAASRQDSASSLRSRSSMSKIKKIFKF